MPKVALFARKTPSSHVRQSAGAKPKISPCGMARPTTPFVLGRFGSLAGKHIFLKPSNKVSGSSIHSQDVQPRISKPARRLRLW